MLLLITVEAVLCTDGLLDEDERREKMKSQTTVIRKEWLYIFQYM
jgi:hypothetical protein